MSLIEKLEQEHKKADDFCRINHGSPKYLETCDLRDTLKEAIDYIRRPAK